MIVNRSSNVQEQGYSWFAWYPVTLTNGSTVWWENVKVYWHCHYYDPLFSGGVASAKEYFYDRGKSS